MIHRIRLRPAFVVLAVGCMTLFLVVPLVVAIAVLILAPLNVSLYLAPGAVLFVAVLGYAMSSSYQWVELDGGVIRGRKLLTRRVSEQKVADIVAILPLHSKLMGPMENALMDAFLKTDNRGYELRFRDGTKIGLVRGDMAGLDEFVVGLADQMREIGDAR
jgi:hypothetical protein